MLLNIFQVIQEYSKEGLQEDEIYKSPLLVYVSREKRTSQSHHFKAGAVNVLVLLFLSTHIYMTFLSLYTILTCF